MGQWVKCLLINYEIRVQTPKSRVWVCASILLALRVFFRNRRISGIFWLASLANG